MWNSLSPQRDTEVSLEESDFTKKLDSTVLIVEGYRETRKQLSGSGGGLVLNCRNSVLATLSISMLNMLTFYLSILINLWGWEVFFLLNLLCEKCCIRGLDLIVYWVPSVLIWIRVARDELVWKSMCASKRLVFGAGAEKDCPVAAQDLSD